MAEEAMTWHYGLVARWWAEFNEGGPEIEYFRRHIDEYGGPVLDAGCGTGRLLVPFVEAGLTVDGSDVSGDMLAWCQKKLSAKGLTANLYAQAMHQLTLPGKYQCIINCGAFGLGGTREQDLEGMRRVFEHLNPGGAFAFDHYLPRGWSTRQGKDYPMPFEPYDDRRTAADGTELELRSRFLSFNPLLQTHEQEIEVRHYVDGKIAATETSTLIGNSYFMSEIILMLRHVGFVNIRVTNPETNEAPRPWTDQYIMFVAEKPAG